ncbi:hypothetical protein COEREDRAFT_82963 [Coemansia reversa NRRL 1564]|uniref:Uncharacterized protein n=1 Tax=Coemansia reversa (strain ATCC 12441 / NRRL 1564) TaxID=763665 RepID=A0A2G5B5Y9_COERN|nr:hypothetical protein COEREDRAFT_82963 [Coemansia reversa NRRL 1564]|eukprot:PIA14137.1 hypothetical protein COEREDRAFT_82963 [Coemansia reversa NRRL 1564]
MKIFATLAIAASVAIAQQVGSDQAGTFADGPSAVSHPNVNNGQQAQNSLLTGGSKGGNVFSGLNGNTFADSASNVGISDNNMVNPSQNVVSGNTGPSTNGEGNQIGDIIAAVRRRALSRRDAVFNNNAPHSPAWGRPTTVPVFAPVAGLPVYPHNGAPVPGAHVNHNHNSQDATIIQNQA